VRLSRLLNQLQGGVPSQLDVLGIFGSFLFGEAGIIWFGFKCFPNLRVPCLMVYYIVAAYAGIMVRPPTALVGSASLSGRSVLRSECLLRALKALSLNLCVSTCCSMTPHPYKSTSILCHSILKKRVLLVTQHTFQSQRHHATCSAGARESPCMSLPTPVSQQSRGCTTRPAKGRRCCFLWFN
jgi:hypothetical protein